MESVLESVSFFNSIEKHKSKLNDGSCKLSVNPCLLSSINEALDCLKSNGKSTPVDISYDERIILFDLENIIKSSVKLKLVQRNVASFSGISNVSRFESLKNAEFLRISLDKVEGINEGNEINSLSCSRCVKVFDIFHNVIWSNLKIVSLTFCQLERIDVECLANIKSVEELNLSFNNLRSVEGLNYLVNLVSLDVSYNFLQEIPDFGESHPCILTQLFISHNNITSLTGLRKLENLTHFDASDNCIYIKEILVELYSLKNLKWLKLINNPLCLRKYYRMYVSHFLGTIEPPFKFLLDEVPLSEAELDFIGSSKGVAPKIFPRNPAQLTPPAPQPVVVANPEVIQDVKGILKSSNRKTRKVRDVVIVDSSDSTKIPATSSKQKKTGVVIQESVSLDPGLAVKKSSVTSQEATASPSKDHQLKSSEANINRDDVAIKNQVLEQNSALNVKKFEQSYLSDLHSSPESTQGESQTVEVTIHATQGDYQTGAVNGSLIEHLTPHEELRELKSYSIDDLRLLESIDLILQKDKTDNDKNSGTTDNLFQVETTDTINNGEVCENITEDNINNNKLSDRVNSEVQEEEDKSSSDDSAYEDDLTGDENLWPVQKIMDSKLVNMFLVLLDTELKERSTISGRTIATYPLVFIQSCTQVKDDPITIELVFSSLLKDISVRTYVMEFADAKTLMDKMEVFLASRPEEVDEHLSSFLCKSCNATFSVFKTNARTLCTACGSALVTEIEMPLPQPVQEPLSNSSSQSSIVSSSHGAPETKTSINNDTNPSTVSSGEASEKSEISNSLYTSTPVQHKYESDVEIISNPSQSSIEILDDREAPSRKRSSEERHVMITPALPTLEEVSDALASISETERRSVSCDDSDAPDSSDNLLISQSHECEPVKQPEEKLVAVQLTESSSSGSVMTSYEASGAVVEVDPEVAGIYNEVAEKSIEASEISNEAYETCNEDATSFSPLSSSTQDVDNNVSDVYSYLDFTEVDHRIKAFLYQYVFHDDSEELSLLVKCHLWKTGGTNYSACFVLSNKKIYIFIHTSSTYGLDASDWLKLQESIDLKSLKKVFPLVWNLGVGVLINRLNYFLFLQNKTYSDNLLSAIKGLSLKGCDIGSKPSSKVELNLQQVVLTSSYVRDVIDPTILIYTVCPTINIIKDEELEETMKLGGFVMTANEFYIVLGDFSWLSDSGEVPSIHFFQMMSSLIEVGHEGNVINLHFLDEAEAVEVVWRLFCSNIGQVNSVIDSMRVPWENIFAQPLQVSSR